MNLNKFIKIAMILMVSSSAKQAIAAESRPPKVNKDQVVEQFLAKLAPERLTAANLSEAFELTKQLRALFGSTEATLLQMLFDAIIALQQLNETEINIAKEIIARFEDKIKDPQVIKRKEEYTQLIAKYKLDLQKKLAQQALKTAIEVPETITTTVITQEQPSATEITTVEGSVGEQLDKMLYEQIRELGNLVHEKLKGEIRTIYGQKVFLELAKQVEQVKKEATLEEKELCLTRINQQIAQVENNTNLLEHAIKEYLTLKEWGDDLKSEISYLLNCGKGIENFPANQLKAILTKVDNVQKKFADVQPLLSEGFLDQYVEKLHEIRETYNELDRQIKKEIIEKFPQLCQWSLLDL